MQDLVITLGHYGLYLACACAAWSVISALLAIVGSTSGMQRLRRELEELE